MNKQLEALITEMKAAAESATAGQWVRESGEGLDAICSDDDQLNNGFIVAEFQGPEAQANRLFSQSANPANVLALIAALEQSRQEVEHYRVSFSNERIRADKLKQQCDNRTPTEWAYNQACAALHKYKSRVEELEASPLAVRLPEGHRDLYSTGAPEVLDRDQVIEAIRAAGGTVEGE